MNKIIRSHYPVEKLPDDLRADLGPTVEHVTVVVEGEAETDSISEILMEMQDQRVFEGNPVERIRALRAEWDWRDEFLARIRAGDA